ncbi:hypothetical protein E2562_018433 [Oryza meyeriana var. granulata]|uniref:Uncharacterized protein n=1 Tax=Oryza meyeriana var. granulata TaxID=110450 RepID=A0A6G1EMC1_9ORYZ|nr:hypothetical protein E2562_018433 [Oryza meyeriana var. granulata]
MLLTSSGVRRQEEVGARLVLHHDAVRDCARPGLTKVYKDNSPTSLIVVGLLNVASVGLLHYMALVELLAADFMGPKLQGSVWLQLAGFLTILLGTGSMSMAK